MKDLKILILTVIILFFGSITLFTVSADSCWPPDMPYPSVPQVKEPYSGPCPIGTIKDTYIGLGEHHQRDRLFDYRDSPTANVSYLTLGMLPEHIEAARQIAEEFNVELLIRPTTPYARQLIESGKAIPKPAYIKSKTINELDILLKQGLTTDDLGKVGYFNPVMPPKGTNLTINNKTVDREKLEIRFNQRRAEYLDSLNVESFEKHVKEGDIEIKDNGVVQKIKGDKRLDITGDYDIFDVIDSKTKKPITDRKLVEKLYQRLGSELNIQHLWHAMWRYKDSPHADYYQNIDESIIKKHKSEEELIKFPPKGSVEGVFIDTVINTLYPPDGEYIPYSPGASIQYGVLNDEYHGKFVKTDVGIFEPPELSGSTVQLDSENSLPNTLTTGEFAFFQKIPALRDQKYASEALCRGACGMDCNKERCDDQEDIIIPIEGGNCVYTGVVECKSHQGCRDHDTCYDWCAELGEKRVTGFSSIPSAAQFFTPTGFLSNLIFGEQVIPGFCHRICDMRCVDYVSETQGFWSSPLSICINWAGLTGWEDTITTVPYDGTILFSNPPEFKEITPTPTSTPTPTTVSSKVEESCSKGYEFYSTASLSGWEGTEISGDYVSINKKIEGPTVSSICGWDPEIRSYLTAKIDYHERDSTKIKEEFHKEVESKKKSGYDVSIRPITMNNFSGECYETGPRFVGGGMTGDGMYRDARWVNTARGYLVDENGTLIEITYQVVGTGCSGNEHNDFLESKCPAQFNEVKSVSSSIQVKCKE